MLDDGRPVEVERRRMRALLAFLLLHANEPVSTDRLIDEVWGPEPPKTAAASLQNYVSRLRRAIGADAVASQPGAYVLRVDPERFDLARFERLTAEARGAEPRECAEKLRAALGLWRGPALDEFAYEPFARDEVGRLEEARLAALEDCIDAELELGRTELGELERLVEEHPLRERFRAQLMRALYRAGRQADALSVFRAGREALREELGLEPGEELRALQQAILRHDPSLDPTAGRATERPADRRSVTVVLCDLVGSAQLAAQLDPEAYRSLMSRFFELVRAPIERHGGTLEKFLGDAAMAVFGVPRLHEDDALRAVRAALEARDALRAADIVARIGVGSGEVHVLSAEGEPMRLAGTPVSTAPKFQERAAQGEVLITGDTYALARDAVKAEPFGDGWRVIEVVHGGAAYARRMDAPLVGRAAELDRLRAAYGDVRRSAQARVVTIVGEAGIGKTRLMRELVQPLRAEAQILVGRCVSYGKGATYLPVTEVVQQAVQSVEGLAALMQGANDAEQVVQRVAEVTGMAESPAAPGEVFWAVRRFVEAVAHDRPLVLVFDDIQWAEPTLLDLIEYLGEWTSGRVLILCAARTELLETRAGWGGPTSTGFLVELEPLPAHEMERLVLGFATEPRDPEIEERVVERAGGNPLFAEQLLAAAAEFPEVISETPPNVEALIASRLDRLDPGELAVLRRASVVGRRFTSAELADLSTTEETARAEHHLANLAARALIHARRNAFAFHHVLVRDVAYRGIPKTERAALHELAAHGLEQRDAPDELVGYHLEQAHRYVVEVAGDDDRAQALAGAAGDRLGRAGIRAWQRVDAAAAVSLLTRALRLTPERHELACELGIALTMEGRTTRALELLGDTIAKAEGHHRLRAELEQAYVRSLFDPGKAGPLLDAAIHALPLLEAAGDGRALGRAWYWIAHVRGGFYCEYAALEEAAERIAACYRDAGWPRAAAIEWLALALDFGPRPVEQGVARLKAIAADDAGRWMHAVVAVWLGRLEAMRANFDAARAHVDEARTTYRDLGSPGAVADTCGRATAAIELAAGSPDLAAQSLRAACAWLEEAKQTPVVATRAAELANALYEGGRYDEAQEWASIAARSAGTDDLDALLTRAPVEAKLLARAGRIDDAERLARELVQRATATDALNRRAESLLALAEVLARGGADEEARRNVDAALALYDRKGNVAAANRLRAQREESRPGLFVPHPSAS